MSGEVADKYGGDAAGGRPKSRDVSRRMGNTARRGALKGPPADAIFVGIEESAPGGPTMTQTSNRFFDEVARLMNDAAGVAQGVRREFDTLVKTQTERWLRDLDLVKRE